MSSATGGRLGTVYGHKFVLTVGAEWWVVWALATGFADNLIGFCVMRALCGIGGGLMTPNVVALICLTFPPGKKRNLSLALFGAMAPVGAAGGSLISGIIVQLTEWKWLFFMLYVLTMNTPFPFPCPSALALSLLLTATFFRGLLGLVVYGTVIMTVPADEPVDPTGKIDFVGAYLGVGGLTLFNFVWK
jgi:MFS family permease